jgi:hypothetical protein
MIFAFAMLLFSSKHNNALTRGLLPRVPIYGNLVCWGLPPRVTGVTTKKKNEGQNQSVCVGNI